MSITTGTEKTVQTTIGTKPIFFLQSPEWEEFQRRLGRKTWRVGENLVIEHMLPGGFSYLYSPWPVFSSPAEIRGFISQVREISATARSLFLKIDPLLPLFIPQEVVSNETKPLQPQAIAVADLKKSEEDILTSMHSKTRYNIRVAERAGVSVSTDGTFAEFWGLMRETASRDGFSLHPKKHYEALLGIASPRFSNEIFFARLGPKAYAAVMVNFHAPSGRVTYLHGASSAEYRNVMAPTLLHWRVMQEARRRGYELYDLGGVDGRAWPGLTRFKKGFGARIIDLPPSYEIVYRPVWYRVYTARKKLKKLIKF